MALRVTTVNLFDDWTEIVKSDLELKGYTFTNVDSETISIQYFNFLKRIIPQKQRRILKSDVFVCPTDLQTGLLNLENKIHNGDDLSPHLSRKLKNLDEIDDLLYDWGIFHLHLGTTIEGDGYAQRTGPLLFCYYDDNDFYFINVMPHGSWTRQEMLRVIHRNWPHSLESHKIIGEGIVGLEHNVTDQEIGKLRNAKINVLIEVEPGVIYVTPGGGFVASGHSIEVMQHHINNKKYLDDLEKQLEENPVDILNRCFNNDISFIQNEELVFKLVKRNDKYQIDELNNEFTLSWD